MIDTRKVSERRTLSFASMKDILDDVTYLDSGDPPRATGNWTAAQIVQHVGTLIAFSIDGFPGRAPLHLALLGRLMKKRAMAGAAPPGFRTFDFLEPDRGVAWEEAVAFLGRTIGRLDRERMRATSPIFGRLSHEQWVALHCRHAELHFSFIHPE